MKKHILLALLLVIIATPLLALNWYQINRYFGLMVFPPKEVTIADDGAGTSPASTLTTPERRAYEYTCADSDGCTLTLGETNVFDGQWLTIHNVGSNAITLSDSSGVQELNATYAMAQYQYLSLEYQSDRWVEVSRSAASTGVATSGDSATAFFSSGTLEVARGGTGTANGVVQRFHSSLGLSTGWSPADATTYYYHVLLPNFNPATAESVATAWYFPAGTVLKVCVGYDGGASVTAEDVTITVRKNLSDTAMVLLQDWNSATFVVSCSTGNTFTTADNDKISIKIVTPTWVTNPAGMYTYAWVDVRLDQ